MWLNSTVQLILLKNWKMMMDIFNSFQQTSLVCATAWSLVHSTVIPVGFSPIKWLHFCDLLGRIAVLQTWMWRIVTDRVAWSVGRFVCQTQSVGLSHSWAQQKRLHRLRRRLGCGLGWTVEIMLDGSPEVLKDVAMPTNFGTKIAINWLYVNDSD